eukprot:GGOE01030605.1.p1 GENE.GGOE01030605.1~~GGOE01030605.1.p1  ORF type:complete len:187 (-),score=12.07 GGOE01030605.1:1224-1784(-)
MQSPPPFPPSGAFAFLHVQCVTLVAAPPAVPNGGLVPLFPTPIQRWPHTHPTVEVSGFLQSNPRPSPSSARITPKVAAAVPERSLSSWSQGWWGRVFPQPHRWWVLRCGPFAALHLFSAGNVFSLFAEGGTACANSSPPEYPWFSLPRSLQPATTPWAFAAMPAPLHTGSFCNALLGLWPRRVTAA